jgi:GTPase SAR1 family protein
MCVGFLLLVKFSWQKYYCIVAETGTPVIQKIFRNILQYIYQERKGLKKKNIAEYWSRKERAEQGKYCKNIYQEEKSSTTLENILHNVLLLKIRIP